MLFHENCFPYASHSNNNHDFNSLSLPISNNYSHDCDDINFSSNHVFMPTVIDTNNVIDTTTHKKDITDINNVVEPHLTNTYNDNVSNLNEHNATIRCSTWSKRPPAHLIDIQLTPLLDILLLILFPITNSLLILDISFFPFLLLLNLTPARKNLKYLNGLKPCRMNSHL